MMGVLLLAGAAIQSLASPPTPFTISKAYGDGMVLAAAPKQAMVWGFCDPGTDCQFVTVSLDGGQEIPATVGPDQATGKLSTWRVKLPATEAGFMNHTVLASNGLGKNLGLQNVLFGEVWVCSGQSNMEYPIGSPTCWNASNFNCTSRGAQCSFGCTQDAGQTITDMANYDSGIRLFNVGGGSSKTPEPEMSGGEWLLPSKMGGSFSATCWFYGRDVYNALPTKVPVGLISTYVGGTPVEHWTSPEGLAACDGPKPWDWSPGFNDSILWNAMVVPLLRTVHSGVVWYQGENNAAEPRNYNCSFPAMITDWRGKWAKYTDGATAADFPFGWVQLNSDGRPGAGYRNASSPGGLVNPLKPPSDCGKGCAPWCNATCLGSFHEWGDYGQGFTGIRFAQTNTLAAVPNGFQAVIIDTPVASGSIHSPFKQPAGRRLARGGLAVAYGMKSAHAVDPTVAGVELSSDKSSLLIRVGGLGPKGLVATIGADAFEVMGLCSPQPAAGTCDGQCLCWVSTPIASADKTTVTIRGLPQTPSAVRFLWYIGPYGVDGKLVPFAAPIYALADPIPNAAPIPGGADTLPLGPFVLPLSH